MLVGQLCDHLAAGWRLAGHEEDGGGRALLRADRRAPPAAPSTPTTSPPAASPCSPTPTKWRIADDRPAGGPPSWPRWPRRALRIAELAAFLRDPVKAFFRQRLHVDFDIDDPASEDQEPFDLDGLQKWSLWNELITRQAEALHAGSCRGRRPEAGAGAHPAPGELAARRLCRVMRDDLAAPMADMFERYAGPSPNGPRGAPRRAGEPHPPASGLLHRRLAARHPPGPRTSSAAAWCWSPATP